MRKMSGDEVPDIVGVWFVCVVVKAKVVRGYLVNRNGCIVNVLTHIVNVDGYIVNNLPGSVNVGACF